VSCLDATFTLRPKAPFHWISAQNHAVLFCYGADFAYISPYDLPSLHATDRFFFDGAFASDPNLDYSQWANRRKSRFIYCVLDLRAFAASQKELALVVGFDVVYSGSDARVQVYSDAGLLSDETLVYGDNQFLIEVESLDQPLNLYFVHAGGPWYFRGISGYVV
jgi:hypothetical protein